MRLEDALVQLFDESIIIIIGRQEANNRLIMNGKIVKARRWTVDPPV